jgi:hypothetical protein
MPLGAFAENQRRPPIMGMSAESDTQACGAESMTPPSAVDPSRVTKLKFFAGLPPQDQKIDFALVENGSSVSGGRQAADFETRWWLMRATMFRTMPRKRKGLSSLAAGSAWDAQVLGLSSCSIRPGRTQTLPRLRRPPIRNTRHPISPGASSIR